jgi:hypothetical protein
MAGQLVVVVLVMMVKTQPMRESIEWLVQLAKAEV